MQNEPQGRLDVPDLIERFRAGDIDTVVSAILAEPDAATAVHQALWMVANLMDSAINPPIHPQRIRDLAGAFLDQEPQRCRYCSGDETATACECV